MRRRWGRLVLRSLRSREGRGGLLGRAGRGGLPCPGQACRGSPRPGPHPVAVSHSPCLLRDKQLRLSLLWDRGRHPGVGGWPAILLVWLGHRPWARSLSNQTRALPRPTAPRDSTIPSLKRIGVLECMQARPLLQAGRDARPCVPGVRRPMSRHLPPGAAAQCFARTERLKRANTRRTAWRPLLLHACMHACMHRMMVFVAHG